MLLPVLLVKVLKRKEKGQGMRKNLVSWLRKKTSFAEGAKLIPIRVNSRLGKRLVEDTRYILIQWTTHS